MIGRDRELEVIRQHLIGETVRLLTLTGPGGVGKTRLALAAARSVEGAFPGGVWFVDLVPLHDPTHIDATIAHVLHLEEAGTRSSRERVAAYLRSRRVLLVLDNFEHVLPAATRVAELLAICPHLKVLVTSREPLNLRLEQRMILAGLTLPDLAWPTPHTIAEAASGALFLERARLVQPDFAPTREDATALAELLRRLDGMPLAIQITAARSNVLSPTAMLARLRGPALLSSEETRDAPPRHHTLRDSIEWSHALLDNGEQELFRQLAVFAGGWTLEAAEAIVQRGELGAPLWQTLRSLVEKNLVQIEGVGGDDRRYRMLETIREYALERLVASGDLDTARARLADYYLALSERAEREWYGPDEETWLRRVEREHENVRAALRWAVEQGDGELSLRLGGALADFWWIGGHLREGRRWLEQVLALSPNGPPRPHAKALVGAGILAGLMGDFPAARAFLQQALELAVDDPAAMARALTRLGMVAMFENDIRGAQGLLERGWALGGKGPLRWQAATLFLLGVAGMRLGELDRAEATLTESLDLCRTVGNRRLAVIVTSYLALVKLNRRDNAGAAALAAAALSSARDVAYSSARWVAVGAAAIVSAHHGAPDRAIRLLAAMDGWSGSTGFNFIFEAAVREAREEITARARHQMGDPAYETAVTEGRALSADDAVDLARTGLESLTGIGPERATSTGGARLRAFLTNREQAILRLVAEGLPNKQIATSLRIGERTVKTHLSSAMNKLGVDNRARAAVVAVQRGLL